jgi:hypothetical protein
MTEQPLETLISQTMSELRLRGQVLYTVKIDDATGVVCSVVSLAIGTRYVFMDLWTPQDDRSTIDDIRRQLTVGLN